jgi:type II secretory pathway pseudopilin PulG
MSARPTGRQRGALARAFTLVEMLIAMVLTLILVYAIAEFYAYVGDSVKDGRAMIEMNSLMRNAVQRLKADLELITVRVVPWNDDGGYLEIYEGAGSDADADGDSQLDATQSIANNWGQQSITNLLGDGDDMLGMTIRASGEPLTGRFDVSGTSTITSAQHAEVIWWVGYDDLAGGTTGVWDPIEWRQIYRRQLLIRPDLPTGTDPGRIPNSTSEFPATAPGWNNAKQALQTWWQSNDISASIRLETNAAGTQMFRIRANSLADLSRRERRFAHFPFRIDPASGTLLDNFPYPQELVPSRSASSPGVTNFNSFVLQDIAGGGGSRGEDIVLSNILAFDVRAYDPGTVLYADAANIATATTALSPSDPGYIEAVRGGYQQVGTGAFVDLAYGEKLIAILTGPQYNVPLATARTTVQGCAGAAYFAGQTNYYARLGAAYDTWALSYERDGINQDAASEGMNPTTDEGTNGLDDDGVNGVDDVGERETGPPFARALRGLEVKIRLYEHGTRQMRQATVGTDFIAE